MNSGIISSRYARALLKLVVENGRGEAVCDQAVRILFSGDAMPRQYEPEIGQFVSLMKKNGRLEYLRQSLMTFVRLYFEHAGISYAKLVTVSPDPSISERVRSMLEGRTGGRVVLDEHVDPSIIGGFVLQVGDYVLDASVRHQLDTVRKEFKKVGNRML